MKRIVPRAKTVPAFSLFTFVLLFACLFAALPGAHALDFFTPPYTIVTEAATSPSGGIVALQVDRRDAFISIDGATAGTGTWSGTLTPGLHVISISALNCYPVQFPITVAADTRYKITVVMPPLKGLLLLDITPSDAKVYIDGEKVSSNLLEIPVGPHLVIVRKFGFEERSARIEVYWNRTSTLKISLSESIFSMTKFRVRPEVFNPDNRGGYGKASLHFSVTAPGSGTVTIKDSSGREVLRSELPPFSTWDQIFMWKGVDGSGRSLPDGEYGLSLRLDAMGEAQPAPELGISPEAGTEGLISPSISVETSIRMDRSMEIQPSGYRLGRPGLSYFPDPRVRFMLPGAVELGLGPDFGATLALGFRIGSGTALALQGAYDPSGGGSVSAGVSRSLFSSGTFDAGFNARIAWTSSATPLLPGTGTGAEIALPVAFAVGGLRLGFAPSVSFDYVGGTYLPGARTALWYASKAFTGGVSAAFDFDMGASLLPSGDRPILVAAEGRYLLEKTPFTFNARFDFALEPEFSRPSFSAGLGVVW